jgi:hypothetical protein
VFVFNAVGLGGVPSTITFVPLTGCADPVTAAERANASKVLFGGTADRDDLTFWSTLAGDRDEPVTTTDLHGRVASRTVRKVPVLAPAQLSALPPGKVVVFAKGMPPVVGQAPMAWDRADVRAVLRPNAPRVRARAAVRRLIPAVRGWVRAWAGAVASGCRSARA